MVDAGELREVMARFPTGVTVVATGGGAGDPCGLTVNSLTSVSLDPPLVLVCIDRASASHDRLVESGSFAVSILSSRQHDLARRFSADPSHERFGDVPWSALPSGDPVLEGASAWIACSIEAIHPGGDHSILIGRVEATGMGDHEALGFYRGSFRGMEG